VTPTPIRTIRIPDDPWLPAQKATAGRPERVPYVVQLALSAYAKDPGATMLALTQIRDGAPVAAAARGVEGGAR
jgi:hypothetical protein